MFLTETLSETTPAKYFAAEFNEQFFLIGGIVIILAVYLAKFLAGYCAKRWEGNEIKANLVFMSIMGAMTFMSLLVYGISMKAIQGIVFCAILLFSSYSDIKTRTLDDCAHCLMLVTALMVCETRDLIGMAISALVIGGVMLLVGVISKGGGIGGADIKLSGAAAALLGFSQACLGVSVGLIIGVIVQSIKNKRTRKKEGFPLVPYLAIGMILAFFIK